MIKSNNITTTITAREKDFAMKFEEQLTMLRQILGISKIIRKESGTTLVYYEAKRSGDLNAQTTEGAASVDTDYVVEKKGTYDLAIKRYQKTVTLEAVDKYGTEIAVEKTDAAFLKDLQIEVCTNMYDILKKGTLVGEQKTWQAAVAMAIGAVLNQAAATNVTATGMIGFIGIMDLYKYLGEKEITIQTVFGLQYIKDFLGCQIMFLLPDTVLSGHVITTPAENLTVYAIDPSNSDYNKLGLVYTTSGEGNLIGVHVAPDYQHGAGTMFAIMGITFWFERIDLVSNVEVNPNATSTDIAVVADNAMEEGSPAKGLSDGKRKD